MLHHRTRWKSTSFVLISCLLFGMLPTSLAALQTGSVWRAINELFPIEQQAYLKASNSEFLAQFGTSVAINGDMLVVGAPFETANNLVESGAVYVYERNADDSWSQIGYLTASNPDAGDQFGTVVAFDGTTLAVGAPYEDSPTIDPNVNSISNSGAVYLFEQHNGAWTQQALLKASNLEQEDQFGSSLDLRDGTLIVGAPFEDGNGDYPSNNDLSSAGAAYVWTNVNGTWTEQAYLKAPNADADDQFGWSVAANGATVLVGAPFEDGNGLTQDDNSAANAGATYIFTSTNAVWSPAGYLKAAELDPEDRFGWSVDLEANIAAISAIGEASASSSDPADNSLIFAGAVYLFEYADATWSQQAYFKAANPGLGDYFGQQVALADSYLVVGAHREDGSGMGVDPTPNDGSFDAGAVYVFVQDSPSAAWAQQAYIKAFNSEANDQFGKAIALTADQLVVGAPFEDDSGAVYVFGQMNQAPLADAGPDQTVNTLETVTLDASASSDPDNDELSYLWQQSGGPVVPLSSTTGITTTFVAPDDPAVLTWTLTLTDTGGLTATDTIVITVTNQAPLADAGPDQTVNTLEKVTLDASASSDPDNDELSYLWQQSGGPVVPLSPTTGITTTFVAPDDPTVLTWTLTITDSWGLTATDTVVITVTNQAPVAEAGPDQTVDTLETVTLDASASSDPDNDELAYLWQQSGGPVVPLSSTTGITTTFVAPDDPAVLTWTLTITDSWGLTATDTVVITVTNQAPVADAGGDQTVESEQLVQLDASASFDPDNDTPLIYQWSQISGPSVVLSSTNAISPTFMAPSGPAELIFELTVTDSFGQTNIQTETVTINVLAPPEYRIYLPIVRR